MLSRKITQSPFPLTVGAIELELRGTQKTMEVAAYYAGGKFNFYWVGK